jgi:pimeloyl-ACP methyl ester carboxylesterase
MGLGTGYGPAEKLPPEMKSETVRLADGRRLGLLQSGDPDGKPVLFFHGFGASRLCVHPNDALAWRLRVRLIAVDRPGIGLSDPHPGRWLTDWAQDVAALADRLEIGRFAVLGWSSGGPHALVCAACLPERVAGVGLAGSAVPLNEPGVQKHTLQKWERMAWVIRHVPWAARLYFNQLGKQVRSDPQAVMAQELFAMPEPDRVIASQQYFYSGRLLSLVEAYMRGGEGVFADARAILRPWGFRLADVCAPVRLWHGGRDQTWPLEAAQALVRSIPGCQEMDYPEESSLVYLSHWEEILRWLAETL